MKLSSQSIVHNQPIDPRYAFGKMAPQTHVSLADNISPEFSWSEVPEGTKSFVMICTDPDVPSKPDDVNQEDREVPEDLPRVDFYHWVMVNIPADVRQLAEGDFSKEVTPKGKGGVAPHGYKHGVNSFTDWFAGDQDMMGDYYGYDGPCPPFNDSILHHYHFTVYALSIESVDVEGAFDAPKVLAAIEPHILDKATITGTYTLNPRLA